MRQLACRQADGRVQQFGAGEAAQAQAHAVGAGTGAHRGAQIGPGLAQGVFVHGGQAVAGFHALAHHEGGGTGQAAAPRAIAPGTRVKLDLHIHHGQTGHFHQIHLGTVVQGPVLNRQASMRRQPHGEAQGQRDEAFHRAPSPMWRAPGTGLRNGGLGPFCGIKVATVRLSSPK